MDAVTLSELRKPRAFPAVSVMVPAHRRTPTSLRDPAGRRTLLTEVRRRLDADTRVPPGAAEEVVQGLQGALAEVDFGRARDGLVLFAAPGEHHAFLLDQPVEERIVVDHAFATRDLVAAHTRATRYWLVVLSDTVRLWDGRSDSLTEVDAGGFPIVGPRSGTGGPFDAERRRRFHREVAAALGLVNGRDPRPVIVAGVTRDQAFFEEAARGTIVLAGRIDGDHDGAGSAELAELARPVLAAYEDLREVAVLSELEAARGLRRYAAGLAEVVRPAEEGRGAHLVVERGYYAPAVRSADGALVPVDGLPGEIRGTEVVEDAVDAVIDTVLEYGGEVTFVSDGFLIDHAGIALVVRY
ncbi:hypothetical protein [Thermomonospora umbrina]|uniref:Chemotaxis protein n=1 Tax=Thermomonospora umbrina TaxID=111806 RepID=A0A3D9T2H9_9ACTN|nr:hypothetical protein [Thermomonospora umbrina]REE99455.1 hypothetical protein DFJ69_4968 [Thermomonospora umbrina]